MAETTTTTGTFVWQELGTADVEAAKKFYTALFGWTTTDMDMGPNGTYTIFNHEGKGIGGVYKFRPDQISKGVQPHWLAYVGVDDVDASAKKATTLGAKILMPPTDIPDVGRFSLLQDPTGATIAIYKPNM